MYEFISDRVHPQLITISSTFTAFHACIGGCDGCINYNHPGNAGLMSFMEEYVAIYRNNGVKNVMSFMDFIVYSTYAAVDHAIEINNRDCNEEG